MKEHINKEIKLSFLGDITCDRPMLRAARKTDGTYDFETSISALKSVLSNSDYVVGNLETVCAGADYGYNPGPLTYNSPDSFLYAWKQAGITMFTTANNHCLDCDGLGVDRTLRLMDELKIEHTGTYYADEKVEKRYLIKEIKGIKIAFVALTDLLNSKSDGTEHSQLEWNQVNHLRVRRKGNSVQILKEHLKKILPTRQIKEFRARRKRTKGIPLVTVRTDNFDIAQEDLTQIEWAIGLLMKAKEDSDFVIACVHCGGQFNAEPGKYSVQLYDILEPYVDVIIGNHPHVVQRAEVRGRKVRAYSLGSVNLSLSADYISPEYSPEYSIMLNVYLEKIDGNIRCRVTFCLLQAKEDENNYVSVHQVEKDDGIGSDVKFKDIFKRFSGKNFHQWDQEYLLHMMVK